MQKNTNKKKYLILFITLLILATLVRFFFNEESDKISNLDSEGKKINSNSTPMQKRGIASTSAADFKPLSQIDDLGNSNEIMNFIEKENPYLDKYIQSFQQAQVNYHRSKNIFGVGEFESAINSYIALGDLYINQESLTPALQAIINKLNENPHAVYQLISDVDFTIHQDSFIELQLINLIMAVDFNPQQKIEFLEKIITRNSSLLNESEESVNFIPALISLKETTNNPKEIDQIYQKGLNQLNDETSQILYQQAFKNYFYK